MICVYFFPEKTRAEISRGAHRPMSRDLSYETDSGAKPKIVFHIIFVLLCIFGDMVFCLCSIPAWYYSTSKNELRFTRKQTCVADCTISGPLGKCPLHCSRHVSGLSRKPFQFKAHVIYIYMYIDLKKRPATCNCNLQLAACCLQLATCCLQLQPMEIVFCNLQLPG